MFLNVIFLSSFPACQETGNFYLNNSKLVDIIFDFYLFLFAIFTFGIALVLYFAYSIVLLSMFILFMFKHFQVNLTKI